jgi:hypothetical protein
MSNQHEDWKDVVDCRDRQIAAQAALLRSVTGKLEDVQLWLRECEYPVAYPKRVIDSVLETLS